MRNLSTIVKAGLIAGTLDMSAALINFYLKTGKDVAIVPKYIASAVIGPTAMQGGMATIIIGLFLHYVIAFLFTFFFSLIFKKLWFWFRSIIFIAILYGIFIWLIMNLVVVPNTLASHGPISWKEAIISCLILIGCMGYPLAFLFRKNL